MDDVQQGESPIVQKPIRRFNSKLLIAIAAVFLLAIVAVGGISLLKTLRQNYPPEADLTPAINFFERADIYQCSAGADCAVVAGICGEPVSINANFVTEWEDVGGNIHGKISCPAVLYPKIEDMWAACENSRCIAKGGLGNKDYDLLGWQTYRNEEYGFEVKYPANTACVLQANTNESISFGRITVDVLEKGSLSLEEYVTNFLEERSKEPYGWIIESRSNREINGQKGVGIVYRFGGLGRISEVIFIDGENKVFALSWSAGGFLCDEANLFPQILSTFRFVDKEGRPCEMYKACELGTGEIREFNSCDPPPPPTWAGLINDKCPVQ